MSTPCFAIPWAILLISLLGADLGAAGESDVIRQDGLDNPLFPFCIETHDARQRDVGQQVALVKELGFDGIGHLGLKDVPERLRSLDAAGLRLFWIHTTVNLAPDASAYDPQLLEILPLLKDRDVLLSLSTVGRPPSDVSFDAQAVQIFREIADRAGEYNVRVALYHHLDHWTERFEDCVRVAGKVDRPNVGVMFNLCHWARVGREEDLPQLLRSSLPHLFCVAVNGSDRPAELQAGQGKMIQPLDSGSYDIAELLRILKALDYQGPVGLMCWGLPGDARDHLTRSMAAWRKLLREL